MYMHLYVFVYYKGDKPERYDGTKFWNGEIYSFKVFKSVLSDDAVSQLYNDNYYCGALG